MVFGENILKEKHTFGPFVIDWSIANVLSIEVHTVFVGNQFGLMIREIYMVKLKLTNRKSC